MTSFKFPPPPPPPPKASNDAQPSYQSQRGGSNRGRGVDRGRGGDRGRGRGGHGRGGNNSGPSRGNAHGGRGGSRGGHGNSYGGNHQHQQPSRQPAAPTAYANPAFASQPPQGVQGQSSMDPQSFAQAMSFMSTPAGMQSIAAFATHMSSMSSSVPQHPQPPAPTQIQAPRYSPGQHAGQKRKRPENNTHVPPLPPKKAQSGPKPPRAKAAAPPPVPSFGFSMPKAAAPTAKANNRRDHKKRVNLGLGAQNSVDDSSSEEEDIDEEAAFAEKVKVEGVAFEHNGEMISLQTAADVQAYIKDRRRNYPTQQRIAEKAQEAAARREHELEFLYRVKGKKRQPAVEAKVAKPPKAEKKPKEADVKKQEELAALRKRLHESILSKQQAPTNLLGVGYDSDTESDAESSVLSASSVVSSSEDSSSEEGEEQDVEEENASASDSDAPPVPLSSKVAPPPISAPPPASSTLPASQICRHWLQDGRCKFGRACRWAHPAAEKGAKQDSSRPGMKEREGGQRRMGLFEKMVEQELEKADQMALEAIKFLGQNGFLG